MNQDPVVPGSQNNNTAAGVGASPSLSVANDGVAGATEATTNFTASTAAGAPARPVADLGQAPTAQPDPMAANLNQIPAAQPILSNVATPSMVEPANPPKPKRTGLIVGIVVLVLLLLAGGGFALWFFLFYNNPENIAFEAVNSFLREKNVVTTGQMWTEIPNDNGAGTRVEVNLKNSSAGLAGSSDIVLRSVDFDSNSKYDEENAYELTLGSVMMSDGVFYFRVGQLMDTIDKALANSGLFKEDMPDTYLALYQLAEIIDEEWWQIAPLEIIDTISEEVDSIGDLDDLTYLKDFYRCAVDVANQDIGAELAEIYKNNRFFKITKVSQSAEGNKKPASGNSLYLIGYDYQKLADFLNALPKSRIAEQAYACYNNFYAQLEDKGDLPESVDASDFETVTAKDLEESRDEGVKHYLEISNWGHELKGVYFYGAATQDEDGEKSDLATHAADLQFAYSPVTIDAPTESRPVTDLVEELREIIIDIIMANAPVYDPETGEIIDTGSDWDDTWDDSSWNDDDWNNETEPWGEEV